MTGRLRRDRIALVLFATLGLAGCSAFDFNTVEQSIYRIFVIVEKDNAGKVIKDAEGKDDPLMTSGTGFHASGVNYVVTNEHVVSLATEYDKHAKILIGYRKRAGGMEKAAGDWTNKLVPARIKRADKNKDLAILEADESLPGKPLVLADFGDLNLDDGREVKAIGFPTAADFDESGGALLIPTKTDGRISRTIPLDNMKFVQHQAGISSGNSGGPLFDECGVVVGVNAQKARYAENIGLAIYSNEVVSLLRLSNLQPNVHTQQCSDHRTQRLMPYAVGLVGIMLALTSMVVALRRPMLRESMSRMVRAGSATRMSGVDAGRRSGNVETGYAGARPVTSYPEVGRTAAAMDIRLVPTSGGNPIVVRADQLAGGGFVVGRNRDCDIVIENETVSKRHAKLRLDSSGKLAVDDLGSGNGTWQGKERITSAVLGDGQSLRFGNVVYRVEIGGGAAPAKEKSAGGPSASATRSRPGGSAWMLSGFDSAGKVVQFLLETRIDAGGKEAETTWTIGRRPEQVDLVLVDNTVSGQHARFRFRPGAGLELQDAGSSNGTRVDGKPVGSNFVALEGVRTIELGSFKLKLSRV
jgi:pSer/pThr/pTyr-binding forkhead associated (FHA) protein